MKSVWRLRTAGAKRVALQFPEGLLMYACTISDILEAFTPLEQTFILGDVTYGACCVDDMSAAALGADFLIHYGHSCLVPVSVTTVPCMYVFVEIRLDLPHLVDTVALNFEPTERLLLAGVIQFSSAMQVCPLLQRRDFIRSASSCALLAVSHPCARVQAAVLIHLRVCRMPRQS